MTSAPLYRSGVTYVVRGAAGERRVIADRSGRLHFDVDVGAAATAKQDAFDAATESSAPHTEVAVFPPA